MALEGKWDRVRELLGRIWYPRVYALVAVFLLTSGVGLAWGSWRNLCATCPSVAQIRTYEPQQTSKLLAHDGQLIVELGYERRTPVSIEALPPYVPRAVVAVEDKRFYEHGGFDPRSLARAVVGRLTGRALGGGSTITQQLARNMFEEGVGQQRAGLGGYTRKLRELQVARELERSYEKDQLLETYLNEIYMGGVWGFQAASRKYFGKNVTDVNPAEAALLAAILNLPGVYDPVRNPDRARDRRNRVLRLMAEQGYLTPEEAARWREFPVPDRHYTDSGVHGLAPYFEEWVRQILDSRFGDELYRGGLRIYTTLDVEMQRAAIEAMEWGLGRVENPALFPNFDHPRYAQYDTVDAALDPTPYLQGMFVALDPRTGHVKALIGGRDFDHSKFDRARMARRQPGSGFKPFVYAAAIASGIPASHIIMDSPVVYPQPDGSEWRPSNFGGTFAGPMTLRAGLENSVNMIAIKLGWEEVGVETVAQTARRMGIQTEIERFPSTTIGAAEVVPLQLAEAYSGFATLGTKARPFPILRVENDEGETVWEPQSERAQVLDSLVSRIMVDLLQNAANEGTGANHREVQGTLGWESPVPTAGKTGTTNDGTNVWFTGFTPNLLASVWMGMDLSNQPILTLGRAGPQATGGGMAAPVWGRFMRHVYHGDLVEGIGHRPSGEDGEGGGPARRAPPRPGGTTAADTLPLALLPVPEPWPVPVGLTTREVDSRSGKLWTEWCDEENRYTEMYIPGTEPTELCDDTGPRIFRIPRGGR